MVHDLICGVWSWGPAVLSKALLTESWSGWEVGEARSEHALSDVLDVNNPYNSYEGNTNNRLLKKNGLRVTELSDPSCFWKDCQISEYTPVTKHASTLSSFDKADTGAHNYFVASLLSSLLSFVYGHMLINHHDISLECKTLISVQDSNSVGCHIYDICPL